MFGRVLMARTDRVSNLGTPRPSTPRAILSQSPWNRSSLLVFLLAVARTKRTQSPKSLSSLSGVTKRARRVPLTLSRIPPNGVRRDPIPGTGSKRSTPIFGEAL